MKLEGVAGEISQRSAQDIEIVQLRLRLTETEEALAALRSGAADALLG